MKITKISQIQNLDKLQEAIQAIPMLMEAIANVVNASQMLNNAGLEIDIQTMVENAIRNGDTSEIQQLEGQVQSLMNVQNSMMSFK